MFENNLSYEDFIETVWDYVSENVVSDDLWFKNIDLIKEITFDLYNLHNKFTEFNPDGSKRKVLSPKICGKICEIFFSKINNSL